MKQYSDNSCSTSISDRKTVPVTKIYTTKLTPLNLGNRIWEKRNRKFKFEVMN